jgi:hypothetical protein
MDLITGRNETWLNETWKGSAAGLGICALLVIFGAPLHAVTGTPGILLVLLVVSACAAWFAGRLVGILTTMAGVLAAAYLLPPRYSFEIADVHDSIGLYSLALGGVIVSLFCGAAWQLRLEAHSWQASGQELTKLRATNTTLENKLEKTERALSAADRLLNEFALAAQNGSTRDDLCELARNFQLIQNRSARAVECEPLMTDALRRYGCADRVSFQTLPAVWGEEREIKRLFEILVFRAARQDASPALQMSASRLPDFWLFTAGFPAPGGSPLSTLEFCACDRIVSRQGGRCWSSVTGHGDWELRFLLPRRQLEPA